MEPPKFYFYTKASGLVPETLLDEILAELHGNKSKKKQPVSIFEDSGDPWRIDLGHVQHLARLRNGAAVDQRGASAPEEPVDNSDASLDGESSPSDEERLTVWDRRLSDELIRRGFLNRWQSTQLLAGRTKFSLGDYRVLDAIGRGGYGHVFLGCENDRVGAEPIENERFVALKVLPTTKTTPELTDRFLHEIEVQKDFNHPNLVRFLAAGRDGGVHYMVHEFIDGGDLKMLLLREGRLPCDVAVSIVFQLALAVQYLHEHGVLHRDIKPGNVLLSGDTTAKLIDFGLAVPFERIADIPHDIPMEESNVLETQIDRASKGTAKVAGTVDYMAPDQIRNPNEAQPGWDIYSIGCTLYQMLTGTVPFPKGDVKQKFYAHLKVKPTDPRVFVPSIPFDLADLLRSLLAKEPEKRIQTAAEVADRLAPWIPPQGIGDRLLFHETGPNAPEPPFVPFTRMATTEKTVINIPAKKPKLV